MTCDEGDIGRREGSKTSKTAHASGRQADAELQIHKNLFGKQIFTTTKQNSASSPDSSSFTALPFEIQILQGPWRGKALFIESLQY